MQPYRAGDRKRQVIQKNVNELLQKKVREPAQSEWAAHVVLVPKSDSALRFCVDYRRFNALTIRDTYPLPRMDDRLESFADAQILHDSRL